MVSCAACGCSQTAKNKDKGIIFHRFPKDPLRKKTWIKFVNKPNWKPKAASVLCSLHFTDECFDRTSLVKVRLFPTAVPTIEVDRLKYVRNYNPIHTRVLDVKPIPIKSEEILEENCVATTLKPYGKCTPSPVFLQESPEDSLSKTFLKRKISDLKKKNMLKNQRIHELQKVMWRQKKQISSLKSIILLLKTKNCVLEEQ